MDAAVRTRIRYVVLYHDRLAFGRTDYGGVDVSELVVAFGEFALRAVVRDSGIGQPELVGRH